MRLRDEPKRRLEINIVPLIDVMFALLTFFVISTLFLTRSEGLPVNLPRAASAQQQQSTKVTVTLDALGKISLNRKPIALDALTPQVRALVGDNQEVVVVINADTGVDHGQVVAVMDRVRQVRGAKLAIATQKP